MDVNDALNLKLEKERFVSGLSGTSMFESAMMATNVLFLVAVCSTVNRVPSSTTTRHQPACLVDSSTSLASTRSLQSSSSISLPLHVALDMLIVVLPTLLLLTLLADTVIPYVLFACAICLATYSALNDLSSSSSQGKHGQQQQQHIKNSHVVFRSVMMLMTCIAILAVDFDIFPRRFAKAETFGTGSMDVGVGLFVVANGLAAATARQHVSFRLLLQKLLPLILIGSARLLSVKALQYQEHVGEYGVHWNFFFTLAAIVSATSLLPRVFLHSPTSTFSAIVILAAYQWWLLSAGGSAWLMDPHRDPSSLLSLNKEGITSCIGFIVLYILSIHVGRCFCHQPQPRTSNHNKTNTLPITLSTNQLASLLLACGTAWCITILLDSRVERVSRRSCNAAYVSWSLAQGLLMLSLARLFAAWPSFTFQAINRFMLPTFLLANLGTGLINISLPFSPSSISPLHAFAINAAYCLLLFTAIAATHYCWQQGHLPLQPLQQQPLQSWMQQQQQQQMAPCNTFHESAAQADGAAAAADPSCSETASVGQTDRQAEKAKQI